MHFGGPPEDAAAGLAFFLLVHARVQGASNRVEAREAWWRIPSMASMTSILVMEETMTTVSLAQANAHLSELLGKVEAEEGIVITQHGRPVAHVRAAAPPRTPLPLEKLAAFRAGRSPWRRDSSTLVRERRDDGRYR